MQVKARQAAGRLPVALGRKRLQPFARPDQPAAVAAQVIPQRLAITQALERLACFFVTLQYQEDTQRLADDPSAFGVRAVSFAHASALRSARPIERLRRAADTTRKDIFAIKWKSWKRLGV
jgi:hypothetical protein